MATREEINLIVEQLERQLRPEMRQADYDAMFQATEWGELSKAEISDVERRVIAGEEPDFWMDGVAEFTPPAEIEQLHREMRNDYSLAHMRDRGTRYEDQPSSFEQPESTAMAKEKEPAGQKSNEVWQEQAQPTSEVAESLSSPQPSFPRDYSHIANVQANGLQEAVEKTKGVETVQRDTAIGDVVVDPDQRAFRVEEGHFKEVAREAPSYDQVLAKAAVMARPQSKERSQEAER